MPKPKYNYVHGAWNIIDDRTGFKIKSTDSRREWTNSVVHWNQWEARNAQDFVKGVQDLQAVPDPRPGAANIHGETSTTLDADEAAGQTILSVASTTSMTVGDVVQLFMDNDETHLSTISSIVAGDTVTIARATSYKASSGNTLIIYSNLPSEASL